MLRPALFGLLALAVASPAWADALVVPIDHSARLTVAGSAASVLVGNPAVADVTVVDSHTLFVQGRGYGATDVIVLSQNGETLYSGDIVVSAPSSGRVSVYRGGDRTDLACAPACSVSVRSPTGGSSGGASSSGGAPAAATGGNPVAAASNIGAATAAVTP
jgi:Flp pilus assembly secretin CpaC